MLMLGYMCYFSVFSIIVFCLYFRTDLAFVVCVFSFHTHFSSQVGLLVKRGPEPRIVIPGGSLVKCLITFLLTMVLSIEEHLL
jgi:hypothetical protein